MPLLYAPVAIPGEHSRADHFEHYLAAVGKRATSPRRILIEHVLHLEETFDAELLIQKLTDPSRGPDRISRPTIYRTLNELVEAGLLRKVASD